MLFLACNVHANIPASQPLHLALSLLPSTPCKQEDLKPFHLIESNRLSGWAQAVRALTSRLIFLAGVKWSVFVNAAAFHPFPGQVTISMALHPAS